MLILKNDKYRKVVDNPAINLSNITDDNTIVFILSKLLELPKLENERRRHILGLKTAIENRDN